MVILLPGRHFLGNWRVRLDISLSSLPGEFCSHFVIISTRGFMLHLMCLQASAPLNSFMKHIHSNILVIYFIFIFFVIFCIGLKDGDFASPASLSPL
jgi:hypothetical protein